MAADTHTQSFWEHLDVLRTAIVKIVAVAVVFGIAAFFFKEELFAVVLAPKDDGFVTYRLLDSMATWVGSTVEPFSVRLINTGLAQQFCAPRPIFFTNYSGSFLPHFMIMNVGM